MVFEIGRGNCTIEFHFWFISIGSRDTRIQSVHIFKTVCKSYEWTRDSDLSLEMFAEFARDSNKMK